MVIRSRALMGFVGQRHALPSPVAIDQPHASAWGYLGEAPTLAGRTAHHFAHDPTEP